MQSKSSFALAYQLIENDLKQLCEYVDPQDANKGCFSHRTYELFLRTCTELENLWKCILRDKNYQPKDKKGKVRGPKRWNISDYVNVEKTYDFKLSEVEVMFMPWKPNGSWFSPFQDWVSNSTSDEPPLKWYSDYNDVKHDREVNFKKASFENLIKSVGALHGNLLVYFGNGVFTPQPLPRMFAQTRLYETYLLFKTKEPTINIPNVN